jgi:hypothetical protein
MMNEKERAALEDPGVYGNPSSSQPQNMQPPLDNYSPGFQNPDVPISSIQQAPKPRKLHNPFCLCNLFSAIRSLGYVDVCSVLIDIFYIVLSFIAGYPYTTWPIIQII